jgi:hypothetical protein
VKFFQLALVKISVFLLFLFYFFLFILKKNKFKNNPEIDYDMLNDTPSQRDLVKIQSISERKKNAASDI